MDTPNAESFVSKLCNEETDLLQKAGENCRHIYNRLPQLYKQTLDHHSLPHFIVSDLFLAAVKSGMYIERQSNTYYQPESSTGVYLTSPEDSNSHREFSPKGSITPSEDKLRLPSFYSRAISEAQELERPPNPQDISAPTLQASVILSIGITFGELVESERSLVWGVYSETNELKNIYVTRTAAESEKEESDLVMPVTVIDSKFEHPLSEEEFQVY